MRKSLSRVLALLLLMAAALPALADDAPGWLQSVAKAELPPHKATADLAVLYDETNITVKDDGQIYTARKVAYKILRPGGRMAAVLRINFDDETKVTYLKGWTILQDGKVFEAKDKDSVEASAFTGELYTSQRIKALLPPEADVGTVVGYEYEQKGRPYLFQHAWYFQHSYPVRQAAFSIHLPKGWEYKATWVNYPEQHPTSSGDDIIWSVVNVPAIEDEPSMPAWDAVAGRMQITFLSPKPIFRDRSHLNWSDMAAWYGNLVADRRLPTPALQAKVTELVAGKKTTLEKIRTLAAFAQRDIRYVAIEIGIGGYLPHPAGEIFGSRYGDCKDKATLLSTMLKQIGVESYYVVAQTDRGIVTQDVPVGELFNHVVLAIVLPPDVKESFPAMVDAKAGKFLIFDPTDEMTPFGTLPPYLEDNYGLLVANDGGELVHMPLLSPEASELVRTAKLTLGADGSLIGEVQEVRTGAEARRERYLLQQMSARERTERMENYINRFLGTATLQDYSVENADDPSKDLVTHYKFSSAKYGKVAGPLLLVRPRLFGQKTEDVLSEKARQYPFAFESPTLQTDVYEYQLPAGFTVDELPDPTKAEMNLAAYSSKVEQKGNVLRYERRYELKGVALPATEEMNLKKFYSNITADERASAVLKRASN